MLALLRTNQFVGNILLVFYLLLVRFPFYIYPQFTTRDFLGGVGWNFIQQSGWADASYSNIIWASIIALITAVGLNIIENKHRLSGELNLIPGALFLLLASLLPAFNVLNPAFLALPLMLVVMDGLIRLYKEPRPAKKLFNIGFWLSVACLFYPSAIWFLGFIIVGLNIMRAFRFKEFLMVISGWLTLFFLVGAYHFWHDSLGYFIDTQFGNSLAWMDWELQSNYWMPIIPLGVVGLILVWGLLGFTGFQIKKSIQAKKSISLLFVFMLFTGFTFFVQPGAGMEHVLFLFPGLAYVLTFTLIRAKSAISELIHLLLIFGLIVYQFVL